MAEKKERKKINLDLIILAVAAVVLLVLYLCSVLMNPILIKSIDPDEVEKIIFQGRPMDEDAQEEFIALYNSSKYDGRYKNDAGSTSEFNVKVHFTGGENITIWDDDSRLFVTSDGQIFQIENEDLYEYLMNKIK